jgi:integrative and conjugative element protein (TIGR02256 family)
MGFRRTAPPILSDVHDAAMTAVRRPVLLDVLPAAYASIVTAAVTAEDGRETGGILLGHDASESVIRVRRAGDAGADAIRRPERFVRDAAHAQRLADAAFAEDGSVWVGEWHTHPVGQTRPSATDVAGYAALLDDRALGLARFVSVVVTANGDHGWTRPVLTPWLVDNFGVHGMTLSVVTATALRPRPS